MNERSFIVKRRFDCWELDACERQWPAASALKNLRQPSEWRAEILKSYPPTGRYLVGVSGGRDSVALLHWLISKDYRRLIVCHLDHRLRGRASSADARFVQRLAETLKLPFVGATANVKRLAAESKRSLETAARFARFEFFAKVARRRRCYTIFLGHHADDFVETFLLNLFRGAGGEGSRSTRAVALHSVGETELTVVRPLLSVWRSEIDAYIASAKLQFREDATNVSILATRNRLRHKIIPFLEEEFGRQIRQTIWRTAMIAADENVVLEEAIPETLRDLTILPVAETQKLPVALQRRLIRNWLRKHEVADLGFDLIEQTRGLLDHENGPAKINLPGNQHARRRAGKLFIE